MTDADAAHDSRVVRPEASRSSRGWWRRPFRAFIGLALGAAAMVYLFRGTALPHVRSVLQGTSPVWLALAVVSVGVTQAAKVSRWRQILGKQGNQLPPWILWRALLLGQAVNLLAPVRLGDVARAVMVGHDNVGSIFTFYTVAVEKAWEALMLLLCLGLLLIWGPGPEWLSTEGVIAAATTLLVWVLVLGGTLWGRRHAHTRTQSGDGLAREWLRRLWQPAATLAKSLAQAAVDGRLLCMALMSIVVWGLGTATNVAVFTSMGLAVHWSAALLVLATTYAGAVVPASPARLGLFHVLVVLSLAAYGVEREPALACGIVLHMVVVVPLLLAGGVAALIPGE